MTAGVFGFYVPQAGDKMGFFVSAGNARGVNDVTSVRERSNVVTLTLPANDQGDFTFPASVDPVPVPVPVPPTPEPAPVPVPPAPEPSPLPVSAPLPAPDPIPSTPIPSVVMPPAPTPAPAPAPTVKWWQTLLSAILAGLATALGTKLF